MLDLDVSLSYPRFTLDCKQALNLDKITGILGHSGCGKTSLLRIIAGLNQNASGTIRLHKQTLQSSQQRVNVSPEKRKIGFVFQDARLFPHLSVRGNLQFALNRCSDSTLAIDEVIELTQISALVDHHIEQLSAGEKQRVALARALLAQPRLLLLDEPLSALDNRARAEMVRLLKDIHQRLKLPMIYVSHSISEIQQLADDVLVMSAGKIIDHGHVHQVINNIDSVLTGEFASQTSLTLKIKQHIINFGLSQLGFTDPQQSSISLYSNLQRKPINSHLRCYILANDISITLNASTDSSVMNSLPGVITDIKALNKNTVAIKVTVLNQLFSVNITRYSTKKLNLEIDKPVFIQFKASAIKSY